MVQGKIWGYKCAALYKSCKLQTQTRQYWRIKSQEYMNIQLSHTKSLLSKNWDRNSTASVWLYFSSDSIYPAWAHLFCCTRHACTGWLWLLGADCISGYVIWQWPVHADSRMHIRQNMHNHIKVYTIEASACGHFISCASWSVSVTLQIPRIWWLRTHGLIMDIENTQFIS